MNKVELNEKIKLQSKMSTSTMELNEEIKSKSKNFHNFELDDRLLKVKSIRRILMQPICYVSNLEIIAQSIQSVL